MKDETPVRRHLNDWLNEGKLKPDNGGADSHLSEAQSAELIEYLTNNLLPTPQAIMELVDEGWEIRYTLPGHEQVASSQWLPLQGVFRISSALRHNRRSWRYRAALHRHP